MAIQDRFPGITPDERKLLRQVFDKIAKETFGTTETPRELSPKKEKSVDAIN